MIKLTKNSRASSHSNKATVPTRKSTLPIHARAVSEAILWISPMSLLIRDTISPSEVFA
jgi:hypothetical protein